MGKKKSKARQKKKVSGLESSDEGGGVRSGNGGGGAQAAAALEEHSTTRDPGGAGGGGVGEGASRFLFKGDYRSLDEALDDDKGAELIMESFNRISGLISERGLGVPTEDHVGQRGEHAGELRATYSFAYVSWAGSLSSQLWPMTKKMCDANVTNMFEFGDTPVKSLRQIEAILKFPARERHRPVVSALYVPLLPAFLGRVDHRTLGIVLNKVGFPDGKLNDTLHRSVVGHQYRTWAPADGGSSSSSSRNNNSSLTTLTAGLKPEDPLSQHLVMYFMQFAESTLKKFMSEGNRSRVVLPNAVLLLSTTPLARFQQDLAIVFTALELVGLRVSADEMLHLDNSSNGGDGGGGGGGGGVMRHPCDLGGRGQEVPRTRSINDFVDAARKVGVDPAPWHWHSDTPLPPWGWVTPESQATATGGGATGGGEKDGGATATGGGATGGGSTGGGATGGSSTCRTAPTAHP